MQKSAGRKIHELAEQTWEKGDFEKALVLTDQALLAYQKANDYLGLAEIIASRFLTLRHLFETTRDKNYLILAKHTAMASVEIAENSGDKQALAIPLFNLAKAQETLGELSAAVGTYKKALENITNNPPETHNRPAVLADFKVHLATCEYKAGDKSALDKSETALNDLQSTDESNYNKHVWLSGGHMRIAEMLKTDNPQKAKEHLQKAKEIIDSDERLKLRKKQWEKLADAFE